MFEPKIIAYLCSWCSYTGADTAGISRLKSPANLRAVRVPCSGRVSPEIVMRTFDQGADGVLVLGCHIGECHYDSGNHRAAKRLPVLQRLMAFAGLEPERLRLDWVSASEGERFSRVVTEFTDTVRALGPVQWNAIQEPPLEVENPWPALFADPSSFRRPKIDIYAQQLAELQATARDLLASGRVDGIIGYELGSRGRTRPAFIHKPEQVERLVWNQDCTHNLTAYLSTKLGWGTDGGKKKKPDRLPKAAIVVKPCDSRALNVLLSENRFHREQVYVIGMACQGVRQNAGHDAEPVGPQQARCTCCSERTPFMYDTLIGEPTQGRAFPNECLYRAEVVRLDQLETPQRLEYWLSQFDQCLRCYACRQACPMCDCPTCLYERDDSLWVGMGIRMNEKRAFHLGRAFHLAGRCVGCEECERACPIHLPIGLLNRKMAHELLEMFGHRAGIEVGPSPFVTILNGEESLP